MKPMLARTADAAMLVSLLNDDDWVFSTKLDGIRKIINMNQKNLRVWGRDGQLTGCPPRVHKALLCLSGGDYILDGELIGPKYVIFDLVRAGDIIGPKTPFVERHKALVALAALVKWPPCIEVLDMAWTPEAKLGLYKETVDACGEGLILRRSSGVYETGRSVGMLKFKLVHDIDCVVTAVGVDGKSNLELTVYRDGDPVVIGNVTALNGDGPLCVVGDVVVVNYLYASADGHLINPTRPQRRVDKGPLECTWDQLVVGQKYRT